MDEAERERVIAWRKEFSRGRRRRRHDARPPVPDEDREPAYDPDVIAARVAAIRATKPEPARRRVSVLVCRDVRWAEKGDHNG